jgi:hypothetical protein
VQTQRYEASLNEGIPRFFVEKRLGQDCVWKNGYDANTS